MIFTLTPPIFHMVHSLQLRFAHDDVLTLYRVMESTHMIP